MDSLSIIKYSCGFKIKLFDYDLRKKNMRKSVIRIDIHEPSLYKIFSKEDFKYACIMVDKCGVSFRFSVRQIKYHSDFTIRKEKISKYEGDIFNMAIKQLPQFKEGCYSLLSFFHYICIEHKMPLGVSFEFSSERENFFMLYIMEWISKQYKFKTKECGEIRKEEDDVDVVNLLIVPSRKEILHNRNFTNVFA